MELSNHIDTVKKLLRIEKTLVELGYNGDNINNLLYYLESLQPYEVALNDPYFDVVCEVSQSKKEAVWDKLINWLNEQGVYSGELGMQSDTFIIQSPEVMADIIDDIIQFEVKDCLDED